MDFQIGDKVSFINEKQDGYIIAIKGDKTCVVEIEDGFTLDAIPRELVKINELNPNTKKSEILTGKLPEIKIEIPDFIKIFSLENTVTLVAIPDNGKVLSGKVDYYLVNGSDLEVLFVFSFLKSKMTDGKMAGVSSPGTSTALGSFTREELIEAEKLVAELLFFKKGLHPSFPRVQKELNIEIPSLVQNFPNVPSPFSFALCNLLINFGHTENPDLAELFQKYKSDLPDFQKISKPSNTTSSIKRLDTSLKDFGLSPSLSEVDLHIEEIVEDASGLSSGEMINIQLSVFHKELDKALLRRASKIVFIHGVGNGKLKNALRNELKSLKINYRDGAYDRYGAGATEVLLT